MTFRRPKRSGRYWSARIGLAVSLAVGLVISLTLMPFSRDPLSEVRASADAAIKTLRDGDLLRLDQQLAVHRGQPDFAYFFTARTTPRMLGDALATVSGRAKGGPLQENVDPDAYEMALTDLAGTLSLATYGIGPRALPPSWTDDFVRSITAPRELFEDSGKQRAHQDAANTQNLLLLLARGFWSAEFLEQVTPALWAYDKAEGADAWPVSHVNGAKYALAPNGTYLTDGMLALTAALTSNPAASRWAFTDFLPGTKRIDGSDYTVGKFTHYLLFEHRFPKRPDDGNVGMSAVLTALSSATDATYAPRVELAKARSGSSDSGPIHDAHSLKALAEELTDDSGCSWSPVDYWNCAKAVATTVLKWIQHWGHLVLDILSFATFPFPAIGITAAATNATWYAIEGDYASAGLSLASAVPGLAFTKIAKAAKATAAGQKLASAASRAARAAKDMKVARAIRQMSAPVALTALTASDVATRPVLRASTKRAIENAANKSKGKFIDPNTNQPITGKFDYGHKPGHEWRCIKAKALAAGWTRQQLNDYYNNPDLYQIEDRASNRSHKYEADVCNR